LEDINRNYDIERVAPAAASKVAKEAKKKKKFNSPSVIWHFGGAE
jgi:hypothetical protein